MENEPVILKLLRVLLKIVGYACIAFIIIPYGLVLASKGIVTRRMESAADVLKFTAPRLVFACIAVPISLLVVAGAPAYIGFLLAGTVGLVAGALASLAGLVVGVAALHTTSLPSAQVSVYASAAVSVLIDVVAAVAAVLTTLCVVRARALYSRRCTSKDSGSSEAPRASLGGALAGGSIQRQILAELGFTCVYVVVIPLSVPLLLSPWRWRLYRAEAARHSGDVGKIMVTIVVQSLKALSDWPALLLLAPLLLLSGVYTRTAWHILTKGSADRWARDLSAVTLRLAFDLPFLLLALPLVATLYRLPSVKRRAAANVEAADMRSAQRGATRPDGTPDGPWLESPWPLRHAICHQAGMLLCDLITLVLAAPPLLLTVYRVPRALRAAKPYASTAWGSTVWHRTLLSHAGAVVVDLVHCVFVLIAVASLVRATSVLRDCMRKDAGSETAWRGKARGHAMSGPFELVALIIVVAVALPVPYRLIGLARKLWNTPDPSDRAGVVVSCIGDSLLDIATFPPLLAGASLAPWRAITLAVDSCGRTAPLKAASERRRDALVRFVLALADWLCVAIGVPELVLAFYRVPAALRAVASAGTPGTGIFSTLPRRVKAPVALTYEAEAVGSRGVAQGETVGTVTIPGLGARLAPHRAFLRVVCSALADLPFLPLGLLALAVPWRSRLAWESMREPRYTPWQARGVVLLHALLLVPDVLCWALAVVTTALLIHAAGLWRGLAHIPFHNPFLPRCILVRCNPAVLGTSDRTRSLMQEEEGGGGVPADSQRDSSGERGDGGTDKRSRATASLVAPHVFVVASFWETLFFLILLVVAIAIAVVMPWRAVECVASLRQFRRRLSAARPSRNSPPLRGTKRAVALLAVQAAVLGLADYVAATAALLHVPMPYRACPLLIRLRRARSDGASGQARAGEGSAAGADNADADGDSDASDEDYKTDDKEGVGSDSEPLVDARALLSSHRSLAQRLAVHHVVLQETGLLLLELPLAVLMWATVVAPWRAVLLQLELWRAGERSSIRHRATLRHAALAVLDLPAFVLALLLQVTWRGPELVRRLAPLSLTQWGTARPHLDVGHQLLQLVLDLPVLVASALLLATPWRIPSLLHFLIFRKAGSSGQRRKRVLRQVALGLVDYLCFMVMVAMLLTFWRVPHLWRRFRRSREALNAKRAARQAQREQEEEEAAREAEEWARWRRTLAGDRERGSEGASGSSAGGSGVAPSHVVPSAPAAGDEAASAPPVGLLSDRSSVVPSAPPMAAESAAFVEGEEGEEKGGEKPSSAPRHEPLASELSLLFSALHAAVLVEGSEAARDAPHALLVLGMMVLAPWRAASLRRRRAAIKRDAKETGKEVTAARMRALCRDEGVEWLHDLPYVPCVLLVLVTLVRAVPLVRDWQYLSDSPSRRFAAGQHAALLLLDLPCALSWLALLPVQWRHAALQRASEKAGGYWGRYGADRPLGKRLELSLYIIGQGLLLVVADLPAAALTLLLLLTGWRAAEVWADVRSAADPDGVAAFRPHGWVINHTAMLLVDIPLLAMGLVGAVLAPWHVPTLCRSLARAPRANARRPALVQAFASALLDLPCVLLCCSLLLVALWRLIRVLRDCFSSKGRARTAGQRRACVLEGSVLALCDLALLPAAAILCTLGLGRLPGALREAAATRGPLSAYKPHMGTGSRLRWHGRLLAAAVSAVLDLPFFAMAMVVAATGYRFPSLARAFALEGYFWGWVERCILGRKAVEQPAAVATLSRRFGHQRRRTSSSVAGADAGLEGASPRASIASEDSCERASPQFGAAANPGRRGSDNSDGSDGGEDVAAEYSGTVAERPSGASVGESNQGGAGASAPMSARSRAIADLLPSAPTGAPVARESVVEPSAPPAPAQLDTTPQSDSEDEAHAGTGAAADPQEEASPKEADEEEYEASQGDAATTYAPVSGEEEEAAAVPVSAEQGEALEAGETSVVAPPASTATGDDPTDSDVEAELEHAAWHRRRWFGLSSSLSRAWASAKSRLGLAEEDYARAVAYCGPASSLGGPEGVAQSRQAVLDAQSTALEEVRGAHGGATAVRPRAPLEGVTALPLGAQWRLMEFAGPQDTAKCEVAARHWREVSVFAPHVWERFCQADRFSAPVDRPWLHPKEVYVREWLRQRRQEASLADAETVATRARARYAIQQRRARSAPCCGGAAWALRSGRGIVLATFMELVLDLPFFALAAATALLPWRFLLLLRDCFWPTQRVQQEDSGAAKKRPGALWTGQRRTAALEQLIMALLDVIALPLLVLCALSGYRLRRIRADLSGGGTSLMLLASPYRPRRPTHRRLRAHGVIVKHGLALLLLDSVPLCAFLVSLALAPWRFAGARRRLATLHGLGNCSWYLLALASPLVVVHDYLALVLGAVVAVTLIRLPTLLHGLRGRSRRLLALRGYDLPALAIPYRCAGLLLHDVVTLLFTVPLLLLTVLRLPIALERIKRVLRARADLRRAHRAVAVHWGHWIRAAASTEDWRPSYAADLACADNLAIRGHAVAAVRAAHGEGDTEAAGGQGDVSSLPWHRPPRRGETLQQQGGSKPARAVSCPLHDVRDGREAQAWCPSTAAAAAACVNDQGATAVAASVAAEAVAVARGYAAASVDLHGLPRWAWLPGVRPGRMNASDCTVTPAMVPAPCTAPREVIHARRGCSMPLASGSSLANVVCFPLALFYRCFLCIAACVPASFACCGWGLYCCCCCCKSDDEDDLRPPPPHGRRLLEDPAAWGEEAREKSAPAMVSGTGSCCFKVQGVRFPLLGTGAAAAWLESGQYRFFWPLLAAPAWHDASSTLLSSRAAARRGDSPSLQGPSNLALASVDEEDATGDYDLLPGVMELVCSADLLTAWRHFSLMEGDVDAPVSLTLLAPVLVTEATRAFRLIPRVVTAPLKLAAVVLLPVVKAALRLVLPTARGSQASGWFTLTHAERLMAVPPCDAATIVHALGAAADQRQGEDAALDPAAIKLSVDLGSAFHAEAQSQRHGAGGGAGGGGGEAPSTWQRVLSASQRGRSLAVWSASYRTLLEDARSASPWASWPHTLACWMLSLAPRTMTVDALELWLVMALFLLPVMLLWAVVSVLALPLALFGRLYACLGAGSAEAFPIARNASLRAQILGLGLQAELVSGERMAWRAVVDTFASWATAHAAAIAKTETERRRGGSCVASLRFLLHLLGLAYLVGVPAAAAVLGQSWDVSTGVRVGAGVAGALLWAGVLQVSVAVQRRCPGYSPLGALQALVIAIFRAATCNSTVLLYRLTLPLSKLTHSLYRQRRTCGCLGEVLIAVVGFAAIAWPTLVGLAVLEAVGPVDPATRISVYVAVVAVTLLCLVYSVRGMAGNWSDFPRHVRQAAQRERALQDEANRAADRRAALTHTSGEARYSRAVHLMQRIRNSHPANDMLTETTADEIATRLARGGESHHV